MFNATWMRRQRLSVCLRWVVSFVATAVTSAVQACGGAAAQQALQGAQVAGKFSDAARLCAHEAPEGLALAGMPHVPVRGLEPAESVHTSVVFRRSQPVGAATTSPSSAEALRRVDAPGPVSREAARRAVALAPQIDEVANAYRIDPLLLHSIAHVESRHNPSAVSHAGARGLMQVMPQTGRRFGASAAQELFDPRVSLEVSAAYLKNLQARFGNDLPLVIAAYNAGEGAVEKYGRSIPPYAETRQYVKSVMAHYRLLLAAKAMR